MTEESTKDKISRQDHDTLIRVESAVNNMAADLKLLTDGTASRLTSIETRVVSLEKVNDTFKPVDVARMVINHDQSIRDVKTAYKVIGALTTIITGLVIFILTIVTNLVKIGG